MCEQHVAALAKVQDISELPYGRGYQAARLEFFRVLAKLRELPFQLILVSGAERKEHRTAGGEVSYIQPTVPPRIGPQLTSFCGLILYVSSEREVLTDGGVVYSRMLNTKPNDLFESGDATGLLPDQIPFDYEAFSSAFKENVTD